MQKICQKIVRVQDGLITEIYDGLMYRDFNNNDIALKELLMDDVGLDFDSIIHSYGELIHDLAERFPDIRSYISEQLPEGWLDWAKQQFTDEAPTVSSNNSFEEKSPGPPIPQ